MYAATIDGKRYTFQASGSLWQDALVMQDLQTESLWSQILGEAIMGELEGTELALYPSTHTTFGEFREQYPDGKLLAKPAMPRGSGYGDYFADPDRLGVFGRANTFTQLEAKAIVYGLRQDGKQVAVSLGRLQDDGHVIVTEFEQPVLVAYNREGGTASAFKLPAALAARMGDFETTAGTIVLGDNEAVWRISDGTLVSSTGDHDRLTSVPLLSSFWFAWVSFFPQTTLVQ